MELVTPLPQPNRDRVGALTALILIAYALIRIVTLPTLEAELAVLGLIVPVSFDVRVVMLTLAAALAATGALWVLQSHPLARIRSPEFPAGLLPGLAALGMGAALNQLPVSSAWLIGLVFAGGLLVGVLYAEFVVFDERDPRALGAISGLRTLGIVLVVGVAFAALAGGLRAVFSVPAIFAASTIVCWRSLKLEAANRAVLPYSVACGLIASQIAWGLHYWPSRPMQAALVVGLATYVAIGLLVALLHQSLSSRVAYEFAGVSLVVVAAVLFIA
ncbi:MAG: hypothetical protein BMS9Abin28_2007 [Anaerolineae bacterium]|nr:MAG: hypothetical protein BMS9Abin28_2007 [Anaerolineae bacterium]